MKNLSEVAKRIKALRAALGMTQAEFAAHINSDRGYLSHIESDVKQPGPEFMSKIEIAEKLFNAATELKKSATSGAKPNVQLVSGGTKRQIPVLSFAQAGMAVSFEELPIDDTIETVEYTGNDPEAFALRVTGKSMEPRFPEGTIITVSPQYPPNNGAHVVAKIKEMGVVFKVFHHKGIKITLSSYNPDFPPITVEREGLHWLYRVVSYSQKL